MRLLNLALRVQFIYVLQLNFNCFIQNIFLSRNPANLKTFWKRFFLILVLKSIFKRLRTAYACPVHSGTIYIFICLTRVSILNKVNFLPLFCCINMQSHFYREPQWKIINIQTKLACYCESDHSEPLGGHLRGQTDLL